MIGGRFRPDKSKYPVNRGTVNRARGFTVIEQLVNWIIDNFSKLCYKGEETVRNSPKRGKNEVLDRNS